MGAKQKITKMLRTADILKRADAKLKGTPLFIARKGHLAKDLRALTKAQLKWLKVTGFTGASGTVSLIPGETGAYSAAVIGIGGSFNESVFRPSARIIGKAAQQLPSGNYYFANIEEADGFDFELASLFWGLASYRFTRYIKDEVSPRATLTAPKNVNHKDLTALIDAIWLGRDLVNTPANDMGPDELEQAARGLAKIHKAKVSCITGDKLLDKNFPLIHAVGRASDRPPRLIDLKWGREDAPKITLVGKGICFDTGGLDIKPANGMLLMKKDMGGAAAVLALAHMIMAHKLPVRLRVLIPAAENSISANAFRPSDILLSRAGLSVEIGNTDAEGRLVLADALSLADEEAPDYLLSFATLTGAARVALGPDLPPFFVDDDDFAARLMEAGTQTADPLWRMPFWPDYERMLDSPNADINNTGFGGFAGAITAALFLRRFVQNSPCYSHFDIYGWRPESGPHGPKGGDTQGVRATFAALKDIVLA